MNWRKLFFRASATPIKEPVTVRTWEILATDTTLRRARVFAELAFVEFVNTRGIEVAAITRIAEAMETYAKLDEKKLTLNKDQIKHMVDRFLSWRLPDNFNPDAGISFKPTFNEHIPGGPIKHEPTGTNLFDATQAEAMIRYMIEGK